ncbi:hypothetical protein QFZ36_002288 [Pseudarthrobacter siccitolerans]|uniref:Tannase and feruloyl esterase family protein n=1 Tax=Pseudarthrobacter siccitolerans TaxID=861266 RepID=A0ABU0PL81_9MICC|nr:tannase/feruloyl esterase family alpha/beta hydrolase [Pseudarthrobacter siccitolerans]MDQ0674727.1 hypothetical protein [Pseudarthrobacter siccitolerans]
MKRKLFPILATALVALSVGSLPGVASAAAPPADRAAVALSCDESMKTAFKPTPETRVLLVKAFKAGDALSLAETPPAGTAKAESDVCLVKMLVGESNPGPAGAPSTTDGVGLEVWLPAPEKWDRRIRATAVGGFMGMPGVRSVTDIYSPRMGAYAAAKGSVTVYTDGGHDRGPLSGEFLVQPDGTPNALGWEQLSYGAVHEMAVSTKALAKAYYKEPVKYSYIYGQSSGGRAVYQSAQMFPGDYDGILADSVSLDQTQFMPGLMWPQIVMQRDLADKGLPLLTKEKRDAVSRAALNSCDTAVNGTHDGYLTYNDECKYDPTKDASVLCPSDGGTNATASCVTKVEAQVFNKIWYGPTVDGSVPDPAVDNGRNTFRAPNHLWWGPTRGTVLDATTATPVSPVIAQITASQLAFNLQDLSYTYPGFKNASGTGENRWMEMSYEEFAKVFPAGKSLNDSAFANIDADNPDLTEFKRSGSKMITITGTHDPYNSVEMMTKYYEESADILGGIQKAQDVHRLFMLPGRSHGGGVGSIDANSATTPQIGPFVSDIGKDEVYLALVDWVERNQAPDTFVATSPDGSRSRPLCMYPERVKYLGGDVNAAASYTCQ